MCYKQKCKVVSLNLAHPVVQSALLCLLCIVIALSCVSDFIQFVFTAVFSAAFSLTGLSFLLTDVFSYVRCPWQIKIHSFNQSIILDMAVVLVGLFIVIHAVWCSGDVNNCLSTRSNLPTVPNHSKSPGQRYTADQQCQQLYGPSSAYCAVSCIVIVIIVFITTVSLMRSIASVNKSITGLLFLFAVGYFVRTVYTAWRRKSGVCDTIKSLTRTEKLSECGRLNLAYEIKNIYIYIKRRNYNKRTPVPT